MYYTYILYSPGLDKFYKGHTRDISQRLKQHNSGYSKYTSKGVPWKLIWVCSKTSKSEAYQLEMKLKNLSRSKTIDFILKYHQEVAGPDEAELIRMLI